MKIMDKLFRKNRVVAIGKLRYKNSEGETVTVTKDIRYTVKDGSSIVYMYDLDDVKDHCKRCNYTPIP